MDEKLFPNDKIMIATLIQVAAEGLIEGVKGIHTVDGAYAVPFRDGYKAGIALGLHLIAGQVQAATVDTTTSDFVDNLFKELRQSLVTLGEEPVAP